MWGAGDAGVALGPAVAGSWSSPAGFWGQVLCHRSAVPVLAAVSSGGLSPLPGRVCSRAARCVRARSTWNCPRTHSHPLVHTCSAWFNNLPGGTTHVWRVAAGLCRQHRGAPPRLGALPGTRPSLRLRCSFKSKEGWQSAGLCPWAACSGMCWHADLVPHLSSLSPNRSLDGTCVPMAAVPGAAADPHSSPGTESETVQCLT